MWGGGNTSKKAFLHEPGGVVQIKWKLVIEWIERARKKEIQNMRPGFPLVFWVDSGTIP